MTEEQHKRCHGSVFRANISQYTTKRGIVFKIELNKLKRLSCPGCPGCGWQDDALDWFVASGVDDWPTIINICEAEHGKTYCLAICNISHDWETGYVDGYDVELVEFDPNGWE